MKNNYKSRTLVQLGCGPLAKKTRWIDCDGSVNAWINCLPSGIPWIIRRMVSLSGRNVYNFPDHVKYVNLHRKLPFPDISIDAIYASHVWEHLYYNDALLALKECYRVCKPGGYVRIAVPDLYDCCKSYLDSDNEDRAVKLHERLLYRDCSRPRGLIGRSSVFFMDFHTHKFMYDSLALMNLFKKSGFVDVRECGLHDSKIEEIRDVESETRVGRGLGIAVEGMRGF